MAWSIKILWIYMFFVAVPTFVVAAAKSKTPKQLAIYWAVAYGGALLIFAMVKVVTTIVYVYSPDGWTS